MNHEKESETSLKELVSHWPQCFLFEELTEEGSFRVFTPDHDKLVNFGSLLRTNTLEQVQLRHSHSSVSLRKLDRLLNVSNLKHLRLEHNDTFYFAQRELSYKSLDLLTYDCSYYPIRFNKFALMISKLKVDNYRYKEFRFICNLSKDVVLGVEIKNLLAKVERIKALKYSIQVTPMKLPKYIEALLNKRILLDSIDKEQISITM